MGLWLSPQIKLPEVVVWLVHPVLQSALELGRDCGTNSMNYALYAAKPSENGHPSRRVFIPNDVWIRNLTSSRTRIRSGVEMEGPVFLTQTSG